MGNLQAQAKECEECGQRFGPGELSYGQWVTRRFCGRGCATRNRLKIVGGSEGEARQEAWKLYWRKQNEEKVGVIQTKVPAGHIDGVPVFKIAMHDPVGAVEQRIPLKIKDRRFRDD